MTHTCYSYHLSVVKSRMDRPFDHRSNSSRSTSSDSNDSAIADRMRLSKKVGFYFFKALNVLEILIFI